MDVSKWTFNRKVFKRISVNSNLNLNPNFNRNSNPEFYSNSNLKAQKTFRENEMTSFFGQVSRYRFSHGHRDALPHRESSQGFAIFRLLARRSTNWAWLRRGSVGRIPSGNVFLYLTILWLILQISL